MLSLARFAVAACALLTAAPSAAQGRLGVDFIPSLVLIAPDVYVWEGPLPLKGEAGVVRTHSLVVVTATISFYRYLKPGCVSGTFKALSATR